MLFEVIICYTHHLHHSILYGVESVRVAESNHVDVLDRVV